MSLATKTFITCTILLLGGMIAVIPYVINELVLLAQLAMLLLAVMMVLSIVGYGLLAREKLLILKAQRVEQQHKAMAQRYQHYTDGFGMVHLLNIETNTVENLSTYPGTHHNGTWQLPPKEAQMAWYALVARNKTVSDQAVGQLIIDQQPAQRLDLLTVFTQPNQSFAIIGGQQVGKTFQAQRIAAHWVQTGIQPIVIGPKWDQGEWPGCHLFGGGYDFAAVQAGMAGIEAEARRRHSSGIAYKTLPVLPVFFDDWTAIVAKLPGAEDFVLEALTLYASVNIALYFIIHLDTANAWGVGKIGAALKNNFIKLYIKPGYDASGRIDRAQNTGWLIYPGEGIKTARQIPLFSGTGAPVALPAPQPSEEERVILAMLSSGASRRSISREVWGKVGQFYNDKIDRVAAEWGEK